MFKKIKNSIDDFFRGYSIQKNATEELAARKRYRDYAKHFPDYHDYLGIGITVYIRSCNAVQREVSKMKNTPSEDYGRKVYCLSHKKLWREALSEMNQTKPRN